VLCGLSCVLLIAVCRVGRVICRLASGMLEPGNGSRQGVPNILLIITDGLSDHPPQTWIEAIEARRQGISVIAVSTHSTDLISLSLHLCMSGLLESKIVLHVKQNQKT